MKAKIASKLDGRKLVAETSEKQPRKVTVSFSVNVEIPDVGAEIEITDPKESKHLDEKKKEFVTRVEAHGSLVKK